MGVSSVEQLIASYVFGGRYSYPLAGLPADKETRASSNQDTQAAELGISDSSFRLRLEKHISDVAKGKGYLSSEVPAELDEKDSRVNASLSKTDPKMLKLYQGFISGLAYDKKARVVASMDEFARAMGHINRSV
jgi:hypothetical protein